MFKIVHGNAVDAFDTVVVDSQVDQAPPPAGHAVPSVRCDVAPRQAAAAFDYSDAVVVAVLRRGVDVEAVRVTEHRVVNAVAPDIHRRLLAALWGAHDVEGDVGERDAADVVVLAVGLVVDRALADHAIELARECAVEFGIGILVRLDPDFMVALTEQVILSPASGTGVELLQRFVRAVEVVIECGRAVLGESARLDM